MENLYEEAKFNLYLTRFVGADSFEAMLYRLFDKADAKNKVKLGVAFPVQAEVWHDWYMAESERKFFEEYLSKVEAI